LVLVDLGEVEHEHEECKELEGDVNHRRRVHFRLYRASTRKPHISSTFNFGLSDVLGKNPRGAVIYIYCQEIPYRQQIDFSTDTSKKVDATITPRIWLNYDHKVFFRAVAPYGTVASQRLSQRDSNTNYEIGQD
jgi:hypothetical protein